MFMNVIPHPKECPKHLKSVAAIGFFDGVHLGHQKIIEKAIRLAKRNHKKSVVVTFDRHPQEVLHPARSKSLLTNLEHKLCLIRKLKPDYCYVIRFTKAFSRKTPRDFVKQILHRDLKATDVVVGFNFRFGHERQGDVRVLGELGRQFGYCIWVVSPVKSHKHLVSSSRIREAVKQGDLPLAKSLLGHPVSMMGKVISGDGKGKTFGFPTANLKVFNQVVPSPGVYLVRVKFNKNVYKGLLNIGPRAKFLEGKTLFIRKEKEKIKIEIHILNFRKTIYGKTLFVEIIKKLRDTQKFNDADSLKRQVFLDIKKARLFFKKQKKR